MALRNRLSLLVVGAVGLSALNLPLTPTAAAASEDADAGIASLLDGAPPAEEADAALGTRTGPAAALATNAPERPRLDPAVTEAAGMQDAVPVIIRLRAQADLPSVAAEARHAARAEHGDEADATRGATVVQALQATAETTQGGVAGLLDQLDATDVTPYWIFNGFSATVPATAIGALAAHPDVASVALDEEITLPETEPGEPRLPTSGVERVKATDVWGDYGFTGEGVVVGIMDGGVDASHPGLADSYRVATATTSTAGSAPPERTTRPQAMDMGMARTLLAPSSAARLARSPASPRTLSG